MLKTPIRNQIVYTARTISVIDVTSVKKVQILIRRCVEDGAAGHGLHLLHMSEGPFSHDADHIYDKLIVCSRDSVQYIMYI